jgi:hypothetical protein
MDPKETQPSRSNTLVVVGVIIAALVGVGWYVYRLPWANTIQVADNKFNPKVEKPTYNGNKRPRIIVDAAHNNYHTAEGRYKPLAEMLRSDGYTVESNRQPFTQESLSKADVLVVAFPRPKDPNSLDDPFAKAEIEALERWVNDGGSLLFVVDLWPTGVWGKNVAEKFGVRTGEGDASDPDNFLNDPNLGGPTSNIVFQRAKGFIADHPIMNGRDPSERVERIVSFTGQALEGPPNEVHLLAFSDTAYEIPRVQKQEVVAGETRTVTTFREKQPIKGKCQAMAFNHGKGRVVFLGEASMITAQTSGQPFGMNMPGFDNRKFALNIFHWLSRAI